MQQNLREGEVEQILPAKAKLMAENDGWTLIDVRPYPDYCESHAWGAKNAQLYAPLEVNTLAKSLKQAATLALFPERLGDAYAAVEPNEYFLDEMQECVEWGDKVILYCGTGGVIGQADINFADGRQTASLIAAHELAARGGERRTSSTWRADSACGRRSKGSTWERCPRRIGDGPGEARARPFRLAGRRRRSSTNRLRVCVPGGIVPLAFSGE